MFVLLRLATYIVAVVVFVREKQGNTTGVILACSFLVSGAIALWVLPGFTGFHYDYSDMILMNIASDPYDPYYAMDWMFVLYHLGTAFCLGWLLARIIKKRYHFLFLVILPIALAILAELFFRFGLYNYLLSNSETLLSKRAVASMGPSFFAGIGTTFCAIFIRIYQERFRKDSVPADPTLI